MLEIYDESLRIDWYCVVVSRYYVIICLSVCEGEEYCVYNYNLVGILLRQDDRLSLVFINPYLSIISVTRLFLSARNPWLCVAELLLLCPCRLIFVS